MIIKDECSDVLWKMGSKVGWNDDFEMIKEMENSKGMNYERPICFCCY